MILFCMFVKFLQFRSRPSVPPGSNKIKESVMRRIGVFAAIFVVMLTVAGPVSAQPGSGSDPAGNVGINLPSFDVRMSMGFNYDLLRPLTGVSFSYPAGYLGLNIPIGMGANLRDLLGEKTMNDMFSDTSLFRAGDNFKPTAGASQNTNSTVRVDVPMLGGVGSFAYTQNFFFDFNTALGGSSVISAHQNIGELAGEGIDGFLSLRGALRIPLSINMGWETMTFGYAYRVNDDDNLIFALNMHRHLFSMDVRLRADIDLLGHVNLQADNIEFEGGSAPINLSIDDDIIDFSSDKCNGSAQGRFRAEAWTPSLGVKWWRFSLTSRFGLDTKAKGSARGGFVVPRVVNLETGDVKLLEDFKSLTDSLGNNPMVVFNMLGDSSSLIPKEIDSISYEINEALRWKMPQGHTLAFDIIPNRLSVSYTKLFGEINMRMDNIVRTTKVAEGGGTMDTSSWLHSKFDTLKVDLGVAIDNIIMLQLNYPSFFINAGICGIEARSGDNYALRDSGLKSLKLGDVVMVLPVLNCGVNLGTKLQLRLEADILPLPAVRTGVNYYF